MKIIGKTSDSGFIVTASEDEMAKLANQLRAAACRVDSINQVLASPIVEVEVKS